NAAMRAVKPILRYINDVPFRIDRQEGAMIPILFGIFIILHGLVHLWFVVLSRGWVPFQPDMGWTGESWILSGVLGQLPLRWLATVLYSLAALGLVLAGIGIL